MRRPRLLPSLLVFLVTVPLATSPTAASQATPAATPVTASGVLLAVTIAADAIPANLNEVFLFRSTIAPGIILTYPEGYVPPNGVGQRLVAGHLAIRPAGDAYVWRAGQDPTSAPTRVPAGTDLLLEAGDASLVPHLPVETHGKDAQGDVHNPGTEPAVALGFTFRSATQPSTFPPGGMDFDLLASASGSALTDLAGQPLTFRLERLVLAPGQTVGVAPPPALELLFVESGELTVEPIPPAGGTPVGSFPIFAGNGLASSVLVPGTDYRLANGEGEDCLVLRLTVVPAG